MDADPAERLLTKIRSFVRKELTDDERILFAALLAPGVSLAYDPPDDVGSDDVGGFDLAWKPSAFPQSLAAALQRSGVRVVGLES